MVNRPFWIQKIEDAWKLRSIVWLSGVRRVGKTTLVKMFNEVVYLNCDLPSTQRILEDPEFFLTAQKENVVIIFDEIHRLTDPSLILKIASDEFPNIKIIATGSSTLAATKKFRDSLTGRKTELHLGPVLWTECNEDFHISDLDHRLFRGGMPEMLLNSKYTPEYYTEWIDSFYARDIQELFSIRNRSGFLSLFKLLLRQSGGLADYTQLAKLSSLSRPTVMSHIEALRIAHAVSLLTPFHGGSRKELTQRPKIYAFDTGFVALIKGWESVRAEDRGYLWEHLVFDTLFTVYPNQVFYWRDKNKNEIDFIVKESSGTVNTYECKINPDYYKKNCLKIFRRIYPNGNNYVISPMITAPFKKRMDDLVVEFISLKHLSAKKEET